MANCKDCVHYEACQSQVPRTFWDSESFYKDCEHFKDKSRFAEFPCKVGDTVYVITTCANVIVDKDWETGATECPFEDICNYNECCDNNEMIYPTTISSIYNEGNGWLFELRNLVFSCNIDDFDTVVFFDRKKAEKVLKERNNM